MLENDLVRLKALSRLAYPTATAREERPGQDDMSRLPGLSVEELGELSAEAASPQLREAIDAEVRARIGVIITTALERLDAADTGSGGRAGVAELLGQAQADLGEIMRRIRPNLAAHDPAAKLAYLVYLHLERMARELAGEAVGEAIDSVTGARGTSGPER